MTNLPVYLFRDSFGPFLTLLDEHKIRYHMDQTRDGAIMNSAAGILQIVLSPEVLTALTAVVVAYLNRPTRKIVITVGNTVVQAEGLTKQQLSDALAQAKNITVIETAKLDDERQPPPAHP